MKTSDIADTDDKPSDAETNKAGLARRFGVGVRTIENWLNRHIITGRMAGGEIFFDVADSDARLLMHRDSGRKGDLQTSGTRRGL